MFAPALPSAMNCPTAHFRPSASRAEPTESADVQIPRAFNLGLGGGIYALMRKPANRKLVRRRSALSVYSLPEGAGQPRPRLSTMAHEFLGGSTLTVRPAGRTMLAPDCAALVIPIAGSQPGLD